MLTPAKRVLIAAVVIAAAGAPSAATARINLDPAPPAPLTSSQPASPTSVQARSGGLAGPATPVTAARVRASGGSETAVQSGFEWGDAGVGAAGMLLLLGAGAAFTAALSRRRAQPTRVSRPVRG